MSFDNDRQLVMQKNWIKSKIDKALRDNNLRYEAQLQQYTNDQVLELEQQNAKYALDMNKFEEYCNSLQDCKQLRAIALVIALEENAFDNINDIVRKASLVVE